MNWKIRSNLFDLSIQSRYRVFCAILNVRRHHFLRCWCLILIIILLTRQREWVAKHLKRPSIGFTQYRESRNDRFVCVLQLILFRASPRHSLPSLEAQNSREQRALRLTHFRGKPLRCQFWMSRSSFAFMFTFTSGLRPAARSSAFLHAHAGFRLRFSPLLALLISAEYRRFHTFVEREKNVVFHRTRNDRRCCLLRFLCRVARGRRNVRIFIPVWMWVGTASRNFTQPSRLRKETWGAENENRNVRKAIIGIGSRTEENSRRNGAHGRVAEIFSGEKCSPTRYKRLSHTQTIHSAIRDVDETSHRALRKRHTFGLLAPWTLINAFGHHHKCTRAGYVHTQRQRKIKTSTNRTQTAFEAGALALQLSPSLLHQPPLYVSAAAFDCLSVIVFNRNSLDYTPRALHERE